MVLSESYLGKWLSLVRIQSTPVTVITLCLGYITVSQSLNLYEIIPLVVVGCLGHWGFYAQNDVMDYEYDIDHKSIDKPLISDVINKFQAQVISTILIAGAVTLSIYLFNLGAAAWFILSAIAGLTYNFYSKTISFSGLYLSVWGVSIVMTGAYYTGLPNLSTFALALGVAVHMLVMTMMGDIKDIDAEEPSIPRLVGVYYTTKRGSKWISSPSIMKKIWVLLDVIEAMSIIFIIIGSGIAPVNSIPYVALTLLGLVAKSHIGNNVFSSRFFSEENIKNDIVLYEVVSVLVYITVISSIINIGSTAILIFASIVWGLLWQKTMYGRFFYFP